MAENLMPRRHRPQFQSMISWLRAHRIIALVLAFLATAALASSWLVFPYFFEGRTILKDVGGEIQAERQAVRETLAQHLTRYAAGPGEAEVEVLFATPVYFERASTPHMTAQYQPEKYLVFIINESTHTVDLPLQIPEVQMLVDGVPYTAVDAEGPMDTEHHRSTTVRFERLAPDGTPILRKPNGEILLRMTSEWELGDTERSALWRLPITYPEDTGGLLSPVMIMALSAGLLSAVLTPCLLQLIVVYLATLTGVSAAQVGSRSQVPADAGRKMFLIALTFVIGFTIFYTAAGAVIGYAGKTAQLIFAERSREVAVLSGLLVIGLGIMMGVKANAPIVCKIPAPKMLRNFDNGGFVRSALLAMGFSLGCMVCFSGAIMATLLIYVGALGSATTGAAIMFMFSLGVAIPFLAAALFLTRAVSVMPWISRYTPQLGFVSMVVIIAFGLVLVTDNFHTVSDLIYPWLGLS